MSGNEMIFAIWCLVSAAGLAIGLLMTVTASKTSERRVGARIALTSWAWPIWAAAFIIYGLGWMLVALWSSADFNHRQTDN